MVQEALRNASLIETLRAISALFGVIITALIAFGTWRYRRTLQGFAHGVQTMRFLVETGNVLGQLVFLLIAWNAMLTVNPIQPALQHTADTNGTLVLLLQNLYILIGILAGVTRRTDREKHSEQPRRS